MSWIVSQSSQQLLIFLCVLTRVSGLVMSSPIFGPRSAPMQARVFLVVALSLIITPMHWQTPVAEPGNLIQLTVMLAREAALGLALGLALTIFFSSMQLTGTVIGQMSGLQLADVFDPTFDSNVPLFGQLLDLIAMTVFVLLGGHRKVLAALLDTFQWRAPGGDDFPTSLVEALSQIVAESFVVGIRAGAPVMVSLLLAVLILGLISRTLPQLNIFAIGFNVNALILLATLAFSLSTISAVVENSADSILSVVRDAIRDG
ncbi:MAG: flagellar biosynthetic protein FliR [Pirellulaceae bacterium]